MAHRIDVSLKSLFFYPGDGVIRRRLLGGPVVEYISTEQPRVSNNRSDMVARTEGGSLRQVEFQTYNEAGFGVRMLEYYAYLVRTYGEHVVQTVLYLGKDPMRLETEFQSPSTTHRIDIVNLRELDAEPLMASDDWTDNVLAILAKGDRAKAIEVAVAGMRKMRPEDQSWATGTLMILSGILNMEEAVKARLKESDVINVMENKVLGPLILKELEKGLEKGRNEGMQQGMQQGMQELLAELLTEKFGVIPAWAAARLQSASSEDLHAWAKRVLHSASLEDTLR